MLQDKNNFYFPLQQLSCTGGITFALTEQRLAKTENTRCAPVTERLSRTENGAQNQSAKCAYNQVGLEHAPFGTTQLVLQDMGHEAQL